MDRSWSRPETVRGFAQSPPNATLLRFAEREQRRVGPAWALDLGCGAGRNSVPLACLGWRVVGVDLSLPMLVAAAARATDQGVRSRCQIALAPMHAIPVATAQCDLVIAHGVWNLARSDGEFRLAVGEAARVAKPGAGLFVFTFSRHTLPPDARPVPGETFVFTQFSGEPQCFLTAEQLVTELRDAGFAADASVPLDELNRRIPGALLGSPGPVIYEAAFRRQRQRRRYMSTPPNAIPPAEALLLHSLITPTEGGIASRVVAKGSGGNVTIFAFDAGQELSEHQTPLDALVLVLDGAFDLTIAGAVVRATPGTLVRMPANVPHAVRAREASRMMLILLR